MANIIKLLKTMAARASTQTVPESLKQSMNAYRVADMMAQANKGSVRPKMADFLTETLTPEQRIKALEEFGWDTSRPLFFVKRDRPGFYGNEMLPLEPSPDLAMINDLDSSSRRVVMSFDNMTPSEVRNSYAGRRLYDENKRKTRDPKAYAESIKNYKEAMKSGEINPEYLTDLTFREEFPAIYPVYARKGEVNFEDGWSQNKSLKDLMSVYGYPGEEGKFAKGGKVSLQDRPETDRVSALNVIAQELPKWWRDPGTEELRNIVEMVVPQTPSDLALTLMGGPGGKALKSALGTAAAVTYSPESEAGTGSTLSKMLRHSPEAFNWLKTKLGLAPEEAAALRSYVANPTPFQPIRVPFQVAAIENAVATKALTPEQARNITQTREALNRALDKKIDLPAPIFRGLHDYDLPIEKGEVVGGYHPASFTYNKYVLPFFTRAGEDTNAFLQIPSGEVKGIVMPEEFYHNLHGDEGEVLLHPGNRFNALNIEKVPEGRIVTLDPREAKGTFEVSAWKDGGEVKGYAAGGLARRFAKYFGEGMPKNLQGTQIIKEPGGNWLSGSVEKAVQPLKRPERAMQGGNEITLEQALNWPGLAPGAKRDLAINTWLDQKLTKYIKNEMATEKDPVRKLAEEGILHYTPEGPFSTVTSYRAKSGYPIEGVAKSDLAKHWEAVADSNLSSPDKAGDLINPDYYLTGFKNLAEQRLAADPWLSKVPPDTVVHSYRPLENPGFSHLVDELSNALNPASGLPEHLLISPDKLSKVSMEDAVRRVYDINKWRAEQKVAADLARANNAATVLHKEYPEAGYKWVELKAPTVNSLEDLPEGWKLTSHDRGGQIDPILYAITREGRAHPEAAGRHANTPEIAFENFRSGYGKPELEDALKYEGDVMGHCVGGYCDDVREGRSRIFSLRDKKGEPHVTIETQPAGTSKMAEWDEEPLRRAAEERAWEIKDSGDTRDISDIYDAVYGELKPEFSTGYSPTDRILQIKGKQNRAPNPEYLPYVQDFVKSGQWSDVGDIGNAGMMPIINIYDNAEINLLKKLGVDVPPYVTTEDAARFDELIKANTPGMSKGFANGGKVKTMIDDPVQEFLRRMSVN